MLRDNGALLREGAELLNKLTKAGLAIVSAGWYLWDDTPQYHLRIELAKHDDRRYNILLETLSGWSRVELCSDDVEILVLPDRGPLDPVTGKWPGTWHHANGKTYYNRPEELSL